MRLRRSWLPTAGEVATLLLFATTAFALGLFFGHVGLIPRLEVLLYSTMAVGPASDEDRGAIIRAYYAELDRRLIAGRELVSAAYDDAGTFEEARKGKRAELLRLLGMSGSVKALKIDEGPVRRLENVALSLVRIETSDGWPAKGYLLRPLGLKGPRPGVIALHGMGSSANKVAGLDRQDDYVHRFGLELAKAGFTVFVPFLVGRGEELRAVARQGIAVGRPLAGLEVEQVLVAAEYLRGLPEANGRVGAYGISLGGFYALLGAAVDDTIDAVVISGYFNDRDEKLLRDPLMLAEVGGEAAYLPGIAATFSDVDIAMLVLPRPILIEQGRNDPWIDAGTVRRELTRVAQAYAALGFGGRVSLEAFEGGHEIGGTQAPSWLKRWLDGPE